MGIVDTCHGEPPIPSVERIDSIANQMGTSLVSGTKAPGSGGCTGWKNRCKLRLAVKKAKQCLLKPTEFAKDESCSRKAETETANGDVTEEAIDKTQHPDSFGH